MITSSASLAKPRRPRAPQPRPLEFMPMKRHHSFFSRRFSPPGPRWQSHWLHPEKTHEPKPSAGDLGALSKCTGARVRAFRTESRGETSCCSATASPRTDVAKYFPGGACSSASAPMSSATTWRRMIRAALQRLDNSVFDCAATDVFILIGINDLNSAHRRDDGNSYRDCSTGSAKRAALHIRAIHARRVAP